MPRTGRPAKIGAKERAILKEIVTQEPLLTLAEVSKAFTERTGIEVHEATLSKGLREAGLSRRRPQVKVAAKESETPRYGYNDAHRRQLAEQQYPSCLADAEWALVEDIFENSGGRGKPADFDRRAMVNACCYVVRTGCSWRMLPEGFPKWQNVYRTFRRWADAGKFEQMHDRLREQWRSREARENAPTGAVLDAQSTRTSPQGGPSGYDAGKKVKGRKRNLVVDTLGLLLAATVIAANVQDRDGAPEVIARAVSKYPSIQTLFVDGGYAGKCAEMLAHDHAIKVNVVRHPANKNVKCWRHPDQGELFAIEANSKGFVPLPKRWVVERTHAWVEKHRRLIMHHDRLTHVSEAWIWLAGARMLVTRLTT